MIKAATPLTLGGGASVLASRRLAEQVGREVAHGVDRAALTAHMGGKVFAREVTLT